MPLFSKYNIHQHHSSSMLACWAMLVSSKQNSEGNIISFVSIWSFKKEVHKVIHEIRQMTFLLASKNGWTQL